MTLKDIFITAAMVSHTPLLLYRSVVHQRRLRRNIFDRFGIVSDSANA
jgi:hypothetical protein